jgi:hypothetical protein
VEAQLIQPIVLKSVCDEFALSSGTEIAAATEPKMHQPKNSAPLKRMCSSNPDETIEDVEI